MRFKTLLTVIVLSVLLFGFTCSKKDETPAEPSGYSESDTEEQGNALPQEDDPTEDPEEPDEE